MKKIIFGLFKVQPFNAAFWFFFFLILPFIYSTSLTDEDSGPKLIFISALSTILAVRGLINSEWRTFNKIPLYLILVTTGYFFYSLTLSDNFSAGISSFITLLLPFFLLLLMHSNRLLKTELIYFFLPVSAIALCVFALIQFIMFSTPDFLPVHIIRASMGNKNFLSEALTIYLVFCLAGIVNNKGLIAKLNISATILILLTLFLLQTLSAFLCLAFLVVYLLPLFILLFTDRIKRRVVILRFFLPAVIFTAISAFLFFKTDYSKPVKEKIKYSLDILSGNELAVTNQGRQNSIFERLYLWKNSMKLFSESKMFGIGLANWQIYWPKYGMQGASHLDSAIMRYEHPHNEYVLFLTETGIIGLICFSAFFIYLFILAIRMIISKQDIHQRKTAFLMLTGLIFMAILSFFGYPFHRPFTSVLCMLLCLFILEFSNRSFKQKKLTGLPPVILLLLLSIVSLNVSAHRLSGEYYMTKALQNQSNGNFGGMLRMLRKAENKYYELDNSSTPLDWYKGFAMFYSGNDSALYYYQQAELKNPYHVQTLSDIGALLENQGKHEEAITYFNRVISFVPKYYQAHYNLAVAYFNSGKPADALREINARTNIGNEYQNTLDVILARNATIAADSCGGSSSDVSLLSDKLLLRKINTLAIENKLGFGNLLCDTIRSRMNKK